MSFRRVCVLFAMALSLGANVSAQEVKPATPAKPADSAEPAIAAEPVAAATPAAQATTATEAKLDSEKIMAAQAAGYKLQDQNGQPMLCRKELQTGSRVRYRTTCMTLKEWDQLDSFTQAQMKDMARKRVGPLTK